MKQTSAGVVAVRVDAHASTVVLFEPNGSDVERALDVPGGLRAVDERILELVRSEVPGGLPSASTAASRAATTRLHAAIAAARLRLVDAESTSLSVRFPGRMTFVTLEREAVVAALRPEIDAIASGVRELAAGPRTRVVPLSGASAVPGLIDLLPGHADGAAADEYEALVVAAGDIVTDPREEPPVEREARAAATPAGDIVAPEESDHPAVIPSVPASGEAPSVEEPVTAVRPVAEDQPAIVPESSGDAPSSVLRPVWPTIAAAVVLVALGGAAAAIGLSAPPAIRVDPVAPAVTQADPSGSGAESARPTPTPAVTTPTVGQAPGGSAGSPTVTAPKPKPKTPSTGSGEAPASGSTTTTGPGTASVPDPDPSVAPTAPPVDPPTDPSPDPAPTDPTDPGSILGIPIPPILP